MGGNLGDNLILLILILVGLAAAWVLGRQSRRRRPPAPGQELGRDYFVGLNYLLNDEPDGAIDTFIDAIEVNTNTLETHMALGTLLRRRGKVDKSIVVYQDLLQRPRLNEADGGRIKLELVRSYIAAGLLDRAEQLLEELRQAGPEVRRQALGLAIDLYQLEKDWRQAVGAAEELLKISPARERARVQVMASHFYCELAEQDIQEGEYAAARHKLKKAGQFQRNNVRVSLLMGQVEMAQENYREAARVLQRVPQQDPDFESETVIPLLESYRRAGAEKPLRKFIQGGQEGQPTVSAVLGAAEHLRGEAGDAEALRYLIEALRRKPSLWIMDRILQLKGERGEGEDARTLGLFHAILSDYLRGRAMYQCCNCGFEAKSLHWLCPSCSEWGVVKPVKGIAGE